MLVAEVTPEEAVYGLSLLSAVVADGMTQTRHDPDSELMGQGIANMVCPFFGGIPATGAIARTGDGTCNCHKTDI